jgi:hypothetical protein
MAEWSVAHVDEIADARREFDARAARPPEPVRP